MNCLVIGDPHLKPSNMAAAKKFVAWVIEMVKLHKPEAVVLLGDTFHTHNVIRSEVMALIDQWVREMSGLVEQFIILVGNHDMAHAKTPEIHAWLPYVGRYENVIIIDKPISDGEFAYIPYIDSFVEFQQVLDTMMLTHDTIFCHQTFRGANFAFIVAREGAVYPADYSGQIISGHIHKAQELGPVWYPGTPFAQEAADHNEAKGIYLLDTVTRAKMFLQAPLPQWVTHRATPLNFEQIVQGMRKEDKNHLILSGPGPELFALVDTQRFKELKREYGFSVKKESTSQDRSSRVTNVATTLEGAIIEYVDHIYDGSVDRERLKSRCLEALK